MATKSKYTIGTLIDATYWVGVYKPGIQGFRNERVDATLEVISPGRAKVVAARMYEAGSKRQHYWVGRAESQEIDKIKVISRLTDVRPH